MRPPRPLFVLLLALPVLCGRPAVAEERTSSDDWMAVFLQGKKSGWVHSRWSQTVEGETTLWSTEVVTRLELARAGQTMVVESSESIVEDGDGNVVRFATSQSMGGPPMVVEGTVEDGVMTVVTGGVEQTLDYPEGAVGPRKAERLMLAAGLEPGATGEVTTFTGQAPNVAVTTTWTIGPEEEKDVLGRVMRLQRVETQSSLVPMPQTMWIGEGRAVVVVEMQLPGMGAMAMYRTEEAIAKSPDDPAELFMSTLVAPDRAIDGPRELRTARFRLGKREGALTTILEGADQKIVARGDGTLDVEVACWTPPEGFAAYQRPYADADGKLAPYLAATAYCEVDDERVREHATAAVGEERDALAAARRIESYVRDKIDDKNFNVGFATAAEVARSLEGDCTEHGVLACALARAAGMPARVVVGLVYVPGGALPGSGENGVFGYHMWSEVYVGDGNWLPIDAAIGTYDATHIALHRSDLASVNPVFDMVLPVLDVMGQLTIEVL